jgi:hypothetical protein
MRRAEGRGVRRAGGDGGVQVNLSLPTLRATAGQALATVGAYGFCVSALALAMHARGVTLKFW